MLTPHLIWAELAAEKTLRILHSTHVQFHNLPETCLVVFHALKTWRFSIGDFCCNGPHCKWSWDAVNHVVSSFAEFHIISKTQFKGLKLYSSPEWKLTKNGLFHFHSPAKTRLADNGFRVFPPAAATERNHDFSVDCSGKIPLYKYHIHLTIHQGKWAVHKIITADCAYQAARKAALCLPYCAWFPVSPRMSQEESPIGITYSEENAQASSWTEDKW